MGNKFSKFKLGDIVWCRIFDGDILITSKEADFCRAIVINGCYDGERVRLTSPELYDVVGNIFEWRKVENEARAYVKERDKMLLKRDVNEFRKFVKNHEELYEKEYLERFEKASDEILEITLHKMIASVTSLPKKLVQESILWLLERGYSPVIR